MNERDLFRALGGISDDLIEGANASPKKKNIWKTYFPPVLAAAACLCLVILSLATGLLPTKDNAAPNEASRMTSLDDSANSTNGTGLAPIESATEPQIPAATVKGDDAPLGTTESPDSVTTYGNQNSTGFSFVLRWEGKEYNSDPGLFLEDGRSFSVRLTAGELTQAQKILSAMSLTPGTAPEDCAVSFVLNGEAYYTEEVPSNQKLTLNRLIVMVEEAANRVR